MEGQDLANPAYQICLVARSFRHCRPVVSIQALQASPGTSKAGCGFLSFCSLQTKGHPTGEQFYRPRVETQIPTCSWHSGQSIGCGSGSLAVQLCFVSAQQLHLCLRLIAAFRSGSCRGTATHTHTCMYVRLRSTPMLESSWVAVQVGTSTDLTECFQPPLSPQKAGYIDPCSRLSTLQTELLQQALHSGSEWSQVCRQVKVHWSLHSCHCRFVESLLRLPRKDWREQSLLQQLVCSTLLPGDPNLATTHQRRRLGTCNAMLRPHDFTRGTAF